MPIRIELPSIFPVQSVNAWLFKGAENVLVDCGEKTEKGWQALLDGLAENGLSITDLDKVIITHAHLDHMGLAGRICENSDAKIYVPEYAKGWAINLGWNLRDREAVWDEVFGENIREPKSFMATLISEEFLSPYWDPIPAERVLLFPMQDFTFRINEENWDVLHMPGHCVNQIVLHQAESGFLVSADMLLRNTAMPMIDRAIDDPKGKTNSMVQLLDSYERLQKLHLTKIFPGHWEFDANPYEVIERQLAAVQKKVAATLLAIQTGLSDFTDILDQIYPGKRIPPTFFMVLGFLHILIEEGKVSSQKDGDFLKYYAN